MLIGDGVTPRNEGRGYVLRRLLRRAVRSMRLLGVEDRRLPELLPVSQDGWPPPTPSWRRDFERISAVAYAEEEAFRRTLVAGTTILDTAVRRGQGGRAPALSGDEAFALHDTYGFPIDLTLEMAAEQGVDVDEDGFRRLMAEQRDRAKADARAKKTGRVDVSAYRGVADALGPDRHVHRLRRGRTEARVAGLLVDGDAVPAAGAGDERRGRAGPHPVLRRGRRPARRRRPDRARRHRAGRLRGRRGGRRAVPDHRPGRAPGPGARRRGRRRRARGGRGRRRAAPRRSAARTPRPTWCTRRSARCSARPRPRPGRRTRRAGSASTSPPAPRCRPRCCTTSSSASTRCSPTTSRCTPR